MSKPIPEILGNASHITDYRSREIKADSILEYLDASVYDDREHHPMITKQMYMQLTPFVDYFIFPSSSSQSYNTFPGFGVFRIAQIQKERAKCSAFDSVLFWNYAPNDNKD